MNCHEICKAFPDMSPDEFNGLKESISIHGQKEPILTLSGKILDGRHRHKACQELGIDPIFEEYSGDDPVGHVIAKHTRRHLKQSQRAMVAAKIANISHGGNRKNQGTVRPLEKITIEQAAKFQGVSETLVKRARRIINDRPKAVKHIMKGKHSVNEIYNNIVKDRFYKMNEETLKKELEEQKKQHELDTQESEYETQGLAGELPEKEQEKFNERIAAEKAVEDAARIAQEKKEKQWEIQQAHETLKTAFPQLNELLSKIIAASEKCGQDIVSQILSEHSGESMRIHARLIGLSRICESKKPDDDSMEA